ncbi:MAG: PQQ-binding-like beta-propeller repeat protein [Planctomycetota bacterium]
MRRQDFGLVALVSFFGLLVMVGQGLASEAEWPRFRGPAGLGVGKGQAAPLTWSDSQNLRWKTPLPGAGSSSPVVWGGKVFVTCYSGRGSDLARQVVCVSRETGEVLWQRDVANTRQEDAYRGFITEHGYASNTPVTDGEQVFVFLGKSGVVAYSMDGDEQWRVDVGDESSNREWGSAASLTLYGDKLIVNSCEESQSIRALDKATGAEAWKVESGRLELCYNTPTLAKDATGRDELIVPTPGEVWSLNPDNGKLRWYATLPLGSNVSPSAVVEDGVAYLYGGRNPAGAMAVRLGGRGDVTDTHVLWTSRDSSYVATPVLYDGHLYWASDRGQAYCVDAATGETVYRERLPVQMRGRPFYASPVLSGDRFIVPSRYDGIFVFSASTDFKQLAVNRFDGDDSQFNATPALVDGDLLLRSDSYLYCVATE